jgi:hypothetical protein
MHYAWDLEAEIARLETELGEGNDEIQPPEFSPLRQPRDFYLHLVKG